MLIKVNCAWHTDWMTKHEKQLLKEKLKAQYPTPLEVLLSRPNNSDERFAKWNYLTKFFGAVIILTMLTVDIGRHFGYYGGH